MSETAKRAGRPAGAARTAGAAPAGGAAKVPPLAPGDFRFFSLGLGARLALAGGLYLAGGLLGLYLRTPWLGIVVSLAGWYPLMLRKASNAPKDQGLEEWRLVGRAEIDRLEDSLRQSTKLSKRTASNLGCLIAALAVPLLFFGYVIGLALEREDLSFLLAHSLVYLGPAMFFGRVEVFKPGEIALKMPSFRALFEEPLPEGLVLAPYLRFDKDDKGRDVPEDLRLMLELKRPPEDLVGIQLQAAVNKGPNGAVPYLYAVVLTKGVTGPAYALARRFKPRGFVVEAGGNAEFGSVVIRQETGGTGYHTSPKDCKELFRRCLDLAASLQGAGRGA